MSKFIVETSEPLKGKIRTDGAKNAVLPIIAASLMAEGKCIIEDVPDLSDVHTMCELIRILGAEVRFENNRLEICADNIINRELPYEPVKKIRASFLLAAPLLTRFSKVRIQMPGGCPIGIRPIDLHLKGFARMGAEIRQEFGMIELTADKLGGNEIYLDFPSVGATENIIMAAALAEGVTVISNAATEPEITDMSEFLNKMGAQIEGAGTETVRIRGVDRLYAAKHRVIPDRIEAGTFLAAAAITGGDVRIENVIPEHLRAVISKLKEMNFGIEEDDDSVRIYKNDDIKSVDIKTMPYPAFPTDLQPQFMSLMTTMNGTCIINETIFENRFQHVGELSRMGANIKLEGKSAIIKGGNRLTGAEVKATDLRAGAGLIIAALCAEGKSEIGDIYHIERGYCRIEEKLKALGAKIEKLDI
ncbi:MAG: UDP-N-acetylglucosamine 1-carboxyvinyltransferase [Firmicutes bacterium]|nr:UDP-N-acetylglucosamine 1-carboxyvinyltransferase [Bacillota bacterium]